MRAYPLTPPHTLADLVDNVVEDETGAAYLAVTVDNNGNWNERMKEKGSLSL